LLCRTGCNSRCDPLCSVDRNSCDYISAQALRRAGLDPTLKEEAYALRVANRELLPTMPYVTHEVYIKKL
jgi:hypothetical protein